MSVSLTPSGPRTHTAKEADPMTKLKNFLSATMVAFSLTACGGGGGSSDSTSTPAASAPTVTIQVAKVTLTTSVVSTGTDIGSVSDLKASDVADGVVTDKAVWTVSVIGGTPTGALTVSSTGKVLAGGKPLVVPVGSTWTISGTATLGGKTVDFSFMVTGKCTDGLTASGATCKFTGVRVLGGSATGATKGSVVVVATDGAKLFLHAFNGVKDGLPIAVTGRVHVTDYKLANVKLIDGNYATYQLNTDGTFAKVDDVDHSKEAAYNATLAGKPACAGLAGSAQVGDACIADDASVKPTGQTLTYGVLSFSFYGVNSAAAYK